MKTFKAFCVETFKKTFNSETFKEVRIGAVVVIPILLVVEFVFADSNIVAQTLAIIVIIGVLSAAVGAFIRGFLESKNDRLSAMDENEQADAGDDE